MRSRESICAGENSRGWPARLHDSVVVYAAFLVFGFCPCVYIHHDMQHKVTYRLPCSLLWISIPFEYVLEE